MLKATRSSGFAAMLVVVALGSAALAAALAVSSSVAWSAQAGGDAVRAVKARALANACAETALGALQTDNAFAGTGSVGLNGGNCTYVVADDGGVARTVTVTASVGRVTRHLRLITSSFNPLVLAFWEEVP